MEGSPTYSLKELLEPTNNRTNAFPAKPEKGRTAIFKQRRPSPTQMEWLSLPSSQSQLSNSSIAPGQKTPKSKDNSATLASWSIQKKRPEDYKRDKVGKYTHYFHGNTILPILEIAKAVEPRTLSFVVSDLRTRRLAGIKKDKLEELL